ncbi:hypothetical protein [Cupriavidus necator]|uniref:hypothetical protein n=1 Tax=Cupriavidus necator TaxID=106590 RepID=UPI0039C04354
MDHWRLAYLGMRQIPQELSEFELATFFTYSPKERALIDARRSPLYRLAVAVHIGGFSRLPSCRAIFQALFDSSRATANTSSPGIE